MATDTPSVFPQLLIVDDFAESRELLKELLEMEGYAVRTAADGAQALAQMSEHLAQLAIIVEDLLDFNGADLGGHLKAVAEKDWNGARCITIGLRNYGEIPTPSAQLDFDHVVQKPVEFELLYPLLDQCRKDLARQPRVE